MLAVGAGGVTFNHQDSGSTAAYRLITPRAFPVPIGSGAALAFVYDATTGRWRQLDLGGSMLTPYAVTLADATVSGDTTVASLVVPANTWLDGEAVVVRLFARRKNDSGSTRTTLLKVNATGASAQQLASVSWQASANERLGGAVIGFVRTGSLLYVPIRWADDGALSAVAAELIKDTQSDGFGGGVALGGWVELTPTSFAADITLSIIANLAVTNAQYYLKPKHGTAFKRVDWGF